MPRARSNRASMHGSADDKAQDVDTWRTNTMGNKPNNDIRKAARDTGVGMWEIADAMQMSDTDIAILLRRELSQWDCLWLLRAILNVERMHKSKTRIRQGSRRLV